MKIFVDCPHCGMIVGEVVVGDVEVLHNIDKYQGFTEAVVKEVQCNILDCNNHKTTVKETTELFGLIKQTVVTYHETNTFSLSLEYIGPSNKFWLWVALLFAGNDGITVNGKRVWWDFKTGFFGDGVDELVNLKSKSA
ncbi:MAG: hypothetical protein WC791_01535 [Candidatus Paceibacterota bacterium]|jgi:hypothetical protein